LTIQEVEIFSSAQQFLVPTKLPVQGVPVLLPWG